MLAAILALTFVPQDRGSGDTFDRGPRVRELWHVGPGVEWAARDVKRVEEVRRAVSKGQESRLREMFREGLATPVKEGNVVEVEGVCKRGIVTLQILSGRSRGKTIYLPASDLTRKKPS